MTNDLGRLLVELPLPLERDAGLLDAVAIAIALEDACGVTLPDDAITVTHLGQTEAVWATLSKLSSVD